MELNAIVARAENLALAATERVVPAAGRRCSCCGWCGVAFRTLSTGGYLRRGVICPRCGSFERHRALAHFYPLHFARTGLRPRRLVHCAAEPCLRATLSALCDRYETSMYGDAVAADHRLDLTEIALPDASCDAFVMNHVLDCLDDPEAAAREMHRVLRPGGVVLAVVTLEAGARTRAVHYANGMRRVFGSLDIERVFAPFATETHDAAEAVPDRRRDGVPAAVPMLVLRKTVS